MGQFGIDDDYPGSRFVSFQSRHLPGTATDSMLGISHPLIGRESCYRGCCCNCCTNGSRTPCARS
jgi:hypothetical protein